MLRFDRRRFLIAASSLGAAAAWSQRAFADPVFLQRKSCSDKLRSLNGPQMRSASACATA